MGGGDGRVGQYESKKSFLWKEVQYYRMKSNISTKSLFQSSNRIHLPECQSTNDEVFRHLRTYPNGLEEGFMVSTDFQTQGRGQKGNTWQAKPNENLLFSFLLFPCFLEPRHSFWLSAAMAVGLANALEKWLEDVKVKWPNDILVGGEKIAGILIENTISGKELENSVVGIGLNVNQLDLVSGATSLRKIRHQFFDKEEVLASLLAELAWAYYLLQIGGWQKIKSLYYQNLFKMGIPHTYFLPDGSPFRAVLKGISEEGLLNLVGAAGERQFDFKEIRF